jgi:ATP-dependent DNA helicase RecQ
MSTKKQSKRTGAARKPQAQPAQTIAVRIHKLARESFGFNKLRPGQEEAITALLKKRDVLVVQPTGSGKSAIYQITALMRKGAALVISPLIALQKDQVDSINEQDVPEAVALNSTLRAAERREAQELVESGQGKFIFMAPEQLRKQETLEMLSEADVSLFVVDEAHCISEWGHDFRPDYLQLGAVVERLNHPPVLAMTATAAPEVREEIVSRLGMKKPDVLVHGFDRPNLYLRVDHFPDEPQKTEAVVHRVRWAEKPGIVYVSTRKKAQEVMERLAEDNIEALFYHGGLPPKERNEIQDRFMSDGAEVIVATNAFGMGIDKPNIRFVYHHDIPESLDAYYQEIGRAGRDGEKSEAVLFFRTEDLGLRKFLSGESKLDAGEVEQIAEYVADQEGPVEPAEIADKQDLSQKKVATVLQRLEDAGAVETGATGDVRAVDDIDLSQATEAVAEEQARRKAMHERRLEQMREYAETDACRREYLLRYFGDRFRGPCHNCDNCEVHAPQAALETAAGTRREVTD